LSFYGLHEVVYRSRKFKDTHQDSRNHY